MTKRKVSNPLALAVLACLFERPMHPYEMATTMRERGKDQSIKLNYGSLYTVVEALQQHGLIVAQETEREGRRPERTVYRLTDAGRMELVDWVSELLSVPAKEYTSFEAGLSLAGVLPPEDVAALLRQRCNCARNGDRAERSVMQLVERAWVERASSSSRASTAGDARGGVGLDARQSRGDRRRHAGRHRRVGSPSIASSPSGRSKSPRRGKRATTTSSSR